MFWAEQSLEQMAPAWLFVLLTACTARLPPPSSPRGATKPGGPRSWEQALEVPLRVCGAGERRVNALPIYSQPSAFHPTPVVCVPAGEKEGEILSSCPSCPCTGPGREGRGRARSWLWVVRRAMVSGSLPKPPLPGRTRCPCSVWLQVSLSPSSFQAEQVPTAWLIVLKARWHQGRAWRAQGLQRSPKMCAAASDTGPVGELAGVKTHSI